MNCRPSPEAIRAAANDPCSVLLLEPRKWALPYKQWYRAGGGYNKSREMKTGKYFGARSFRATDIKSLLDALGIASLKRDSFLVYGGLTEEGARPLSNRRDIRRKLRGEQITIEEVKRRYLVIDVDDVEVSKVPGTKSCDMTTEEGRERAVRALLTTLPECLRDVTVGVQWTASAGIEKPEYEKGEDGKKTDKIIGTVPAWKYFRLRLLFWLDRAIAPSRIKSWFKWMVDTQRVDEGLADDAIYNAHQPIYISTPTFEYGVERPFNDNERAFIIEGVRDEASIPEAELVYAYDKYPPKTTKRATTPRTPRKVARVGEGWSPRKLTEDEKRCTLDGERLIRRLSKRIDRRVRSGGSRHKALYSAGVELGAAVRDGHLGEPLAVGFLVSKAQEGGFDAERLRDWETRSAFDAIEAGRSAKPEKRHKPATQSDEKIIFGSGDSTAPDVRAIDPDYIPAHLRSLVERVKATPGEVLVAGIPAGAGKSTAALIESLEALERGGSRIIATKTGALAEDLRLRALSLGGDEERIEVLRGALAHCSFAADYEMRANDGDDEAKERLRALRQGYQEGGRRALCDGCPLAQTCAGSRRPRVSAGKLSIMPLDLLEHLADELPGSSVVYIDELPRNLAASTRITPEMLATLRERAGRDHYARWSRRVHRNGAYREAAIILERILAEVKHRTERKKFAVYEEEIDLSLYDTGGALRRLGEEILEDSRRVAQLEGLALLAAPEIYGPPPAANGEAIRAGDHVQDLPSRTAHQFLVDVALEVVASGNWISRVRVVVETDGAARFERIKVPVIADRPTIGLDATALHHRPLWEAVATLGGKTCSVDSLELSGGGAKGIFIDTKALCASELYRRVKGEIIWKMSAPGALSKVAENLAELIHELKKKKSTIKLGILTRKPIAELLRAGLFEGERDPTDFAGDRVATDILKQSPLIRLLRQLKEDGHQAEVGHYGADDVGSNRFEEMDGLALIGSPTPELGAIRSNLRLLGVGLVKPEELLATREGLDQAALLALATTDAKMKTAQNIDRVYQQMTRATIAQAVGRLRALRREDQPLILYAGAVAPLDDDEAVPGVEWSHKKGTTAKSRSPEVVEVERAAEELFLDGGLITPKVIAMLARDLGHELSRDICRGIKQRLEALDQQSREGGESSLSLLMAAIPPSDTPHRLLPRRPQFGAESDERYYRKLFTGSERPRQRLRRLGEAMRAEVAWGREAAG